MVGKLRDETLIYIFRGDEALLGKKRPGERFEGILNGLGGKYEPPEDASIEACAVRECFDEACVIVPESALEKVAQFNFLYTNPPAEKGYTWNRTVHIYFVREGQWSGTPTETKEITPVWVKRDRFLDKDPLLYDQMWEDDIMWLPQVMAGKKLKGYFRFDEDNTSIKDYEFDTVTEF